jgi:hypothetical protein
VEDNSSGAGTVAVRVSPLADIRLPSGLQHAASQAQADGAWKEEDAADVEARMEKDQAQQQHVKEATRADGEMKQEIPIKSRMKSVEEGG